MISSIMFYLAIAWGVMNLLWMILLSVKKARKEIIPQEFHLTIKKTIRVNIYYVFIFLLLGYLFL